MAKDITVETDGTAVNYSGVKKIQTHDTGGDNSLWIPMDETQLGTLKAKKNKTYKASDYGYYGFSKVTVEAKKMAVGKDPNGNPEAVEVDDNGNLVYTELPASIAITTNPSKMSYNNGESISMAGAVVKAYKNGGGIWTGDGYSGGVIPNGELILVPERADASQSTGGSATSGLDTSPISQPIPFVNSGTIIFNTEKSVTNHDVRATGGFGTISAGYVAGFVVMASSSEFAYNTYRFVNGEWEYVKTATAGSYTVNSKTVYRTFVYGTIRDTGAQYIVLPDLCQMSAGVSDATVNRIAWTLIYGTATGGGQPISVKWERPKDGELLTTSFNITVS